MIDRKKYRAPFSLKAETISPVSIGNSEILSPYTDFVFDEEARLIHVLDKAALTQGIITKESEKDLMGTYINGIYDSFDNNRSKFNLRNFIEGNAELDSHAERFAERSVAYYGLNERDRREIKCVVKDNYQPYLPGSSIKGAIKGAILYDWLLNGANGKIAFNRLMEKTLQVFDTCRRDIETIERLATKRHVSRDDKFEIRNLKKQINRNGGRDLGRDFDKVFGGLLTAVDRLFPKEFNHFKPSDSDLCPKDSLIFQLAKRLHYVKGQVAIPVNLEAIKPDVLTNLQLSIQPNFTHPDLAYLNAEKPLENLFAKLNQFHKDNLDMEMELLDNSPWYDKARGRDKVVFEKYSQYVEDLHGQIENALPNEGYLCLGFGKSFFYNSIGMLVKDWNSKNGETGGRSKTPFTKYCQLFFLGKDGQKKFPLTRTVTHDGVPFGWVKLKF